MPIYMNIDGIKGDVTEAKHKDWIELSSVQWGTNRAIAMPTGAGKSRDAQLPHVSEVVGTKNMDRSSVEIFRWTLGGTQGKTVKIDFVTVGGKDSHVYLTYTLTECLISSFSQSSGGDRPMESLSLNFTKCEYKYNGQKPDGSPDTPVNTGWDLAKQVQA
jgi:type VI secretion system secreted protein Hcp